MSYLKKSDVLNAIKSRVQNVHGVNYTIFEAYLGTSPFTHKPVRKAAKSLEKLRKIVNDFYARLGAGGDAALLLTAYQAMDAKNACDLLAQANSGMTLTECVRRTLESVENEKACTTTLSAAFDAYMASITDTTKVNQRTVRSRVGGWIARFGGDRPVSDVTAKLVADDLEANVYAGSEESKTTYNKHLGDIKTFMNWCAKPRQAYIKKNPILDLEPKVKAYVDPKYMRSAEVEKLFRALEKTGGPDLAHAILSFFCGMRQDEIQRVPLGEKAVVIDLDEKYIRVIKVKGQTRGIKPRAFTIPAQALAWMQSMGGGFLAAAQTPNPKFRRHLVAISKKEGIDLTKNAGRHTFCTMFEAAHHDSNALSAIVGNTRDIRDRHYNGVAKPQEGRDYFVILPSPCRPI